MFDKPTVKYKNVKSNLLKRFMKYDIKYTVV